MNKIRNSKKPKKESRDPIPKIPNLIITKLSSKNNGPKSRFSKVITPG